MDTKKDTDGKDDGTANDNIDTSELDDLLNASTDDDEVDDNADADGKNDDTASEDKNLEGDDDDTKADDKKSGDEDPGSDDKKVEANEPAFPEELLEKAESMGISREDALEYSSQKDLSNTLRILESKSNKAGNQDNTDNSKKVDEEKEYDSGLDRAVFRDEIVDAVNALGRNFQKQLKELKAENENLKSSHEQIVSRDVQQKRAEATKEIDSLFGELSDDFTDLVGKGEHKSLKQDSVQFKNRVKVVAMMKATAQGLHAAGQTVPEKKALFDMSIQNLFKKEVVRKSEKAQSDAELRRKMGLGKPGGTVKPTTRAAKAVNANKQLDEVL